MSCYCGRWSCRSCGSAPASYHEEREEQRRSAAERAQYEYERGFNAALEAARAVLTDYPSLQALAKLKP